MYFKSIKLENFRNYEKLNLELDRNLNIFLGNNAQGKTNLLEGLFIMGMGKSFRTNKDKDMIAFGRDHARASSVVEEGKFGRETEIEIVYSGEGKIIKVDGSKLSRTVDLLENIYIVVFSPEDLRIIKDGPDNRRRFLDRELCQIKPVYYSDLGNYKKILRQRNMLLREKTKDKALMEVFDEALSDYGIRIAEEREGFTKRINDISRKIHERISGNTEELDVSYETKVLFPGKRKEEKKKNYREMLELSFEKDCMSGFTSYGPHKDDLKIEINGVDIRQFGSQGQQRTAALSMKLAEIGLIKQETKHDAVLLLDDVLSELDAKRQQFLIEAMKDVQVFITAAELSGDLMKLLPAGKTFIIDKGKVKD